MGIQRSGLDGKVPKRFLCPLGTLARTLRGTVIAIVLAGGGLIAVPGIASATTATLATFTTSPGTGVDGAALSVQPVVELDSTLGTKATTGAQKAVTLGILSQPGSGATITCSANPVTSVSYVATFSGCTVTGAIGTYTLKATASGLTTGNSAAFTVTIGGPSELGFTTEPDDGADGAALSVQPVVTVEDPGGNPLTSGSATVSLAIASGAGTLTCDANSLATTSGAASFSNCSIVGTIGAFTLTASATGLSSATSSAFSLTLGSDYQLAFTTQPGGAAAGANLAPQPKVSVEDIGGNVVTTDAGTAITLSIATQPTSGAVVNCTTNPLSTTTGKVTFAGCDLEGPIGSYQLLASATGLVSATSNSVTVTSGAAKALTFATSPAGGAVGTAFSVQPVVDVVDIGGNLVSGAAASDAVKLAIVSQPGSGATLTCDANPLTATNAVAAFTGCAIVGTAGQYTLNATKSGLTTATSTAFQVDVGTPTQIVFSTQPDDGVDGNDLSVQPVVAIEDAAGNVVANASASIALSVATGSGSLSCDQNPLTTTAGQSVFTGCSIIGTTGTNAYSLSATASGFSTVTSPSFSLTVGSPTQLAFTTQPGGGTDATAFTTANQPRVSVEDVGGNVVTGVIATAVTLALSSQPGSGAVFTCTTNPQNTASGRATFAGCKVTGTIGNYALLATASGLSSATSASFAIALGAASQLVFTTQPGGGSDGAVWSTQPVVTVEDAGANVVSASSAAIKLAIASQPGSGASFGCTTTTVSATSGVASFAGCAMTGAVGNYTIAASTSGLSTASSGIFVVTVGSATQIAFITQPDDGVDGANLSAQPSIAFEDVGGNVVSAQPSTPVTLSIATQPGGGGSLSCDATVVSSIAGAANFSNCAITGQIGTNTYSLSAAASGFASVTSAVFSVTIGPATQLVFTTQPGGGTDGLAWSGANQPKVSLEDVGGNVVTGAAATPITLSIAAQPGTGAGLSCTTNPQNTASGKATFAGCKITGVVGTYSLTAAASGFSNVASIGFSLTVGAASQLAFTTQPGDGVDASGLSTQPVVSVEDVGGNLVSSATSSIRLGVATQPGSGATLACTTNPLTATAGVAAFTGCAITGAVGVYSLNATRSGLTSATSSSFNLAVGAPSQVAFTTQPADAVDGASFGTQPTISIEDAGGNVVGSATNGVTLAVTTGTGTLSCDANPLSATSGVATFSNCGLIGRLGSFKLTASGSGLSSAISATISLTVGTTTSLSFTTAPVGGSSTAFATQPVVSLVDVGNNAVTTDPQYSVSLAIASQPGSGATLTCASNPLATTNGVASFTGCQIAGSVGSYSLSANATGLVSTTSSNFVVGAGAPVALALSGGGLAVQASFLATNGPFTVSLVDQFVDLAPTGTDTVVNLSSSSTTASFASSSGGSRITSLTIPAGQTSTTFYYGDTHAGLAVVSVAATGLNSATTSETTSAGPVAKVAFSTTGPVAVAGGSDFGLAVRVLDAFGNISTTPGVSVTLSSSPAGLVGNTTMATDSFGSAIFSGLSIPVSGSYMVTVSGTGLNNDAIVVNIGSTAPAPPVGLVASVPPNSQGAANIVWAPPAPGTAVSSYAITPVNLTTGVSSVATVVDGSRTSTTLSGLQVGNSYEFTMTATNPGGTSASSVPSNAVEPLGAPASVSVTGTSTTSAGTASASIGIAGGVGSISVTAVGLGTVTVAQYTTPPVVGSAQPGATYFDVSVTPDSSFSLVSFQICGVANGQTVQWQDPLRQTFVAVSKQTSPGGAGGCVSVTVDSTSVPSINQLYGSVFAIVLQVIPGAAASSATAHGVTLFLSYSSKAVFGAPALYKAVVEANGTAAKGGSVRFSVGKLVLCNAKLKAGGASCKGQHSPPSGKRTIVGRYVGTSGTVSAHMNVVIKKATVALSVLPVRGNAGSFRVTVRAKPPGGGTPGGVIEMRQVKGLERIALRNGSATFRASRTSVSLRYIPSSNYLGTQLTYRT